MTTIEVPDPSLVLLVGAAGAGKTTFAARHFAPDEVLSSDAYRALVSGDEANQKVSRVAFSILHRDLERRLLAGQLTVVDATNVEPRNRRELIRRAQAAGLPVVALVLDLHPVDRAGAQRDPVTAGGRGGRAVAARARPDHGRGGRPGRRGLRDRLDRADTRGDRRGADPAHPGRGRGRRTGRRAAARAQPDPAAPAAMSATANAASAIPTAWDRPMRSRSTSAARIVVVTG